MSKEREGEIINPRLDPLPSLSLSTHACYTMKRKHAGWSTYRTIRFDSCAKTSGSNDVKSLLFRNLLHRPSQDEIYIGIFSCDRSATDHHHLHTTYRAVREVRFWKIPSGSDSRSFSLNDLLVLGNSNSFFVRSEHADSLSQTHRNNLYMTSLTHKNSSWLSVSKLPGANAVSSAGPMSLLSHQHKCLGKKSDLSLSLSPTQAFSSSLS